MDPEQSRLRRTDEQSRDIIDRRQRQQREADERFAEDWGDQWILERSAGGDEGRDRAQYWSLLDHWYRQLEEALQRGLPQFTLYLSSYGGYDYNSVLGHALEALVYTVGYNRWRYQRRTPYRAADDEAVNDDYRYNPEARALVPLDEFTVYFLH